MALLLRQSTASQEVLLGPFVDDTDGKTAETALSIGNTDIKIWKAGATTLANKNSGGATHIANGNYYCTLDATDTNTLGSGEIIVQKSGALPVRREFLVLPANVWDSLVAGTDDLTVDTAAIATAVLTTAMTESYSSDGGTLTVAQALYELVQGFDEISIVGTTMTIKRRDGTTTAKTLTLNDGTTPTGATRTG